MADLKKGAFEEEVKTHRIRMTLSSRNVEALEKGELPLEHDFVCTVFA